MGVCSKCQGSGQYMGNGFMMTDCNCECHAHSQKNQDTPTLDKIDRRSKSYQKAIKEIMDINADITREEAVKMFDQAYIKG